MDSFFQIVGNIFGNVFTMLNTLEIPLLGWTFMEFYMRLAFVGIAFLVLGIMFNIGKEKE